MKMRRCATAGRRAGAGQCYGKALRAAQPFFEPNPAYQHHGQRKQEITHGDIDALAVDGRPDKQPKLAGEYRRRQDDEQPAFPVFADAGGKIQRALPTVCQACQGEQGKQHSDHAPCEYIGTVHRLHPATVQKQHGKQYVGRNGGEYAFGGLRHCFRRHRFLRTCFN